MLDTLEARLAEARAGTLGHAEFLQVLCEDELARRDAAKVTRRIRAARFPGRGHLGELRLRLQPQAARRRRSATWPGWSSSRPGRGSLPTGPVGVGKSHLAAALGHQACRRGHDVAFTTCSRLLAHLAGGHADRSFEARVRKLAKITVLICDDFAMREFTAAQADDLYELLTERVGRPGRSLILTSNRSPVGLVPAVPQRGRRRVHPGPGPQHQPPPAAGRQELPSPAPPRPAQARPRRPAPAMTRRRRLRRRSLQGELPRPGRGTRRARVRGRPSSLKAACASPARDGPAGPALTPETPAAPQAGESGQAPACPSPGRGASGEPGAHATNDPANVDDRRAATALSTPRTRCGIT